MTTEVKHKKSKKEKRLKTSENNLDVAIGEDEGKTNTSPSPKKRKRSSIEDDSLAGTQKDRNVDEASKEGNGSAPLNGKPQKKKKHRKDMAGNDQENVKVDAEFTKPPKEKHGLKVVTSGETDDILVDNQAAPMHASLEGNDVTKDKKKKKKRRVENISNGFTTVSAMTASTSKDDLAESSSIPSPTEIETYLSDNSISISAPSATDSIIPILSFSQLTPKIPDGLGAALKGFKEPTPIQACSWPAALAGRDVVGIAETGSGKTLAFGLPALSRLISSLSTTDEAIKSKKSKKSNKGAVTTLVLAPTRELALQTHETLCMLGEPFGMSSLAVYGGVDKGPQRLALQKGQDEKGLKTRMVVGTPGRILDLINEGALDLSQVNYLVLDEADRMLDKGFENDIRNIISHTLASPERQTLMFSATWPDAVRRLASTFQNEPVRITVGSADLTANQRVEQVVEVFDDTREKDSRLLSHLRAFKHAKTGKAGIDASRILVFVLYKKEAARVENNLRRQGYSVSGIHGDLSQSARIAALESFKSGTTGLLVATDVAARGLDIPNVGAVINYSFPLTIEDYIHRIGRTGRGGKSGKSVTFFTGDNHERSLAGELARVLHDGGFNAEALQAKFPMTIKKKTHSVYGAFFRDDIPIDAKPTRIKF